LSSCKQLGKVLASKFQVLDFVNLGFGI
jgi:hypothetical protein